ncbi:ABC transporter ATP-binding protein [Xanthobacter dioxanivorans]|uniref:ABC transporter ATP-binding protein n=1 Tax=Xanthobacter dioxanivorans TaxID=2528964 RepID=A0A974PUX4_9HYPH|nr:ABC transporter ATP-binding protein [Xanthobacter dioxanivorans]QRG09844.1 ABC transporter ATP-binding protein [Xanthobacter dioxanivorans]
MDGELLVTGIRKAYGGVKAVDDVSFSVAPGEMVAIIGPNGAGKSTCFNMLGGQIRPDAGEVRFGGKLVNGLDPAAVWRLGIGRTFQITATFASMSVRENVQMVLLSHHRRLAGWWRPTSAHFRDEAEELLDVTGLRSQADRPCAVLSYGDLKRLELAMALGSRPRLLLMDEPTAGMAPTERIGMMRLVRDLVEGKGISILFTEHDMDVVFGHADRVIVLNRGRVIATGAPAAIRNEKHVQDVYLGGGTMYGAH